MTPASLRPLTWSRVGVAVCVGLITYGAVTALLPHQPDAVPPPVLLPRETAGYRGADQRTQELAVQRVAERYIIACDTTDPAHPAGDLATETALAPDLDVSRDVVVPAVWSTEDRRTTVTLDPPGPPMAEHGGSVNVIVTGIMTVTSNSGPPAAVPVAERITLHLSPGDGESTWRVIGVEVGA